ncbi:hypothetical protein H206_05383 [Candidatus Electrothrix aarhusensis]|uniref:Uncharacterized protein n=1 Tax=Candidatus Electrothrix aarhusensis TaxID=1859131 RepID=A0A444J4N9_9BACT|nr:hypothetical protein H206_05383 [Candidatus Electrothrix aarhusensis]
MPGGRRADVHGLRFHRLAMRPCCFFVLFCSSQICKQTFADIRCDPGFPSFGAEYVMDVATDI